MNTKDDWKRTATIHDEVRLALWSEVFPGGVVPIQVPVTVKVNVPDHENVDAYMLDLDAISDEQREGVITVIAKTFNIPAEEVRNEIDQGVPILAEGVSVLVKDMDYFSTRDLDDEDVDFGYDPSAEDDHNEDLHLGDDEE